MDCWREAEGKRVHDPYYHRFATAPQHHQTITKIVTAAATATATATVTAAAAAVAAVATTGCTLIDGPIIVGAGPSGLAVAACLHELGVPTLILERAECIASLWKHKTYDRLRLHLPKHYCELPLMPFPADLPTYPTKQQFLAYLDEYARRFQIKPVFNTAVETAEYDAKMGLWKVRTKSLKEYRSRWLVVATGENADSVVPEIQGMDEFRKSGRPVVHTSDYRSGDAYCGKKVLVVGCGNSGMEVSLDLCDYGAKPSLVVREAVHVLPREMLGRSTFGLAMWLSKWLPVRTVDRILLLASHFTIGDTANVGLRRPEMGPLELKALSGKTPVLDVGTLSRIQSGQIKVVPAIKRMLPDGAEFVDGRKEEFDAVILATGYRSNVPSWLKDNDFFSDKDGLPRKPFPNGWRGDNGLYSVGFSKKGILGATMDAKRIANDIKQHWDTAKEVELQWTAAAAQIKASLLLSAHGQTPAADKQWQA